MAQNNDNSGLLAFAFVAACAWIAIIFVFAIAAFIAFIMTIICLMAWNKPLVFGSNTITPEEARTFVKCGLAGAFLVPAFAVFCEILFGIRVQPDFWFYLIIGGYCAGSVGMAMIEAQQEEEKAKAAAAAQFYLPQQPSEQPRQPATPLSLLQDQPPFRFATWDDEERRS